MKANIIMTTIDNMRLNTFLAGNRDVVIQKGKFLKLWMFRIIFFGDLPKTFVQNYTSAQKLECEWTDSNRTIYFNDMSVKHFIHAVAKEAYFFRVLTEMEALAEDKAWAGKHRFRVLFDRSSAPAFEFLETKNSPGEIVSRITSHTELPDGSLCPNREVVAFLTDCADTAVLLKLSHGDAFLEER